MLAIYDSLRTPVPTELKYSCALKYKLDANKAQLRGSEVRSKNLQI